MGSATWVLKFSQVTGFSTGQAFMFLAQFEKENQGLYPGPQEVVKILPEILTPGRPVDEKELTLLLRRRLLSEQRAQNPAESKGTKPLDDRKVIKMHLLSDIASFFEDHVDRGERLALANRLLRKLNTLHTRLDELDDAELLTAIGKAAARGSLKAEVVLEFIRKSHASSSREKSRRKRKGASSTKDPLLERSKWRRAQGVRGRSVRIDESEQCQHGVSKFHICALCDPDRYEEMIGRD